MVLDRILRIAPPGTVIPKPETANDFRVKSMGRRRDERALVYYVPSHRNPNKPYEKGVTATEFERAYEELVASGLFTRRWLKEHLPACDKEGGCNFTTIGGLFILLGEAEYHGEGAYRRVTPSA